MEIKHVHGNQFMSLEPFQMHTHSVSHGDHVHPRYVYVASSWRNPIHTAVCAALRSAGIDHYNFKEPTPGHTGFHWSDVGMKSYDRDTNSDVDVDDYLTGLEHPIAKQGFRNDFQAMQKADVCVMVLPCGRSAHLEAGWFCGNKGIFGGRKRLAILLDGPKVTPELMYKMADYIAPNLMDLLGWLGVAD